MGDHGEDSKQDFLIALSSKGLMQGGNMERCEERFPPTQTVLRSPNRKLIARRLPTLPGGYFWCTAFSTLNTGSVMTTTRFHRLSVDPSCAWAVALHKRSATKRPCIRSDPALVPGG